jgi:hypothetical protein
MACAGRDGRVGDGGRHPGSRFEVIANPTQTLPNHARIIHPAGLAEFTDPNLARLATVFQTTTGC